MKHTPRLLLAVVLSLSFVGLSSASAAHVCGAGEELPGCAAKEAGAPARSVAIASTALDETIVSPRRLSVRLAGTPGVTACVAFATHNAWIPGWGGGRSQESDRMKCVQLDKRGHGEVVVGVDPTGTNPVVIANALVLGELLDTRAVPLPIKPRR